MSFPVLIKALLFLYGYANGNLHFAHFLILIEKAKLDNEVNGVNASMFD